MIKELKYVFYFFVIFLFFFFTLKYYFSDDNKKNSYRSIQFLDKKIDKYTSDLIILKNDFLLQEIGFIRKFTYHSFF